MILAIAAAGVWLTSTGVASAAPAIPSAGELALETCRETRADLGARKFRKRYGAKPMRKCVRRETPTAQEDIDFAHADCADELVYTGALDFTFIYSLIGDVGDALANCALDDLGLIEDADEGDG